MFGRDQIILFLLKLELLKNIGYKYSLEGEMAIPAPNRPATISIALKESLRNYLEFRHVFRHAYTFELRWEKMLGLVPDCEKVLQEIELELNSFFRIQEKPN